MRLLGGAKRLQQIKQLYQVFTTKQLLLEWLLEVNMFFGKKLVRSLAVEEVNGYVENNDSIDMRTAPQSVKNNIIHDEDVLKMRWDICLGCEFLKDGRCLSCGCMMRIKSKFAMTSCPEGKWDRYVA